MYRFAVVVGVVVGAEDDGEDVLRRRAGAFLAPETRFSRDMCVVVLRPLSQSGCRADRRGEEDAPVPSKFPSRLTLGNVVGYPEPPRGFIALIGEFDHRVATA